jgi:hypothetical protein
MPTYFYCKHCGKRDRKNPRLKVKQSYCGSPACQRARKNKWERDKLQNDSVYREYRKGVKANWRKTYPDDVYQNDYRKTHPEYVRHNRELQKSRNFCIKECLAGHPDPNIVKTDALSHQRPILPGLYEIYPYITGLDKKIVKTDALIVELKVPRDLAEVLLVNSG